MMPIGSFTCVDCGRDLSGRADVTCYGPSGPPDAVRLLGRCRACQADLPIIRMDQPWAFRWQEDTWRFVLVLETVTHRLAFLLQQGCTSAPGKCWHPVRVIELDQLRAACDMLRAPAISHDDVCDVVLALRQGMWERLTP